MKKIFNLILLLIFTPFISYSQWVESNDGLFGGGVSFITSIDNNIIAGLYGSGVILSTNNGLNWTEVNDGLTSLIVTSYIIIDDKMFIGTYGGGIFLTTNYGSNWTPVNNGLSCKYINCLTYNGKNIFAGTDSGGVFLTTNNGINWIETNNGNNFKKINCLAANDSSVYIGVNYFHIYKSNNNGKNWSDIDNFYFLSKEILCITTIGSKVYVGTSSLMKGLSTVIMSSDNGISWNRLDTIFIDCTIISINVENDKFIVGTLGDGVFISKNNGANWSNKSIGLNNLDISASHFHGNNLYIGTVGNGLYISHNDGENWSEINNGITGAYTNCMSSYNSNIIVGTYGGGVFLSTDNGYNWMNTGFINNVILSVAIDNQYIFAAPRYGNDIYKSSNNGLNWIKMNLNHYPKNLLIHDSLIITSSRDGVFKSTDYGTTWIDINKGLPQISSVKCLTFYDSNIYAGTLNDGIYKYSNNDTIWNYIGLIEKEITCLVINGTDIFAGTDSSIYFSSDNGINWSEINNGLTNKYVQSLAIMDSIVFAGTNDGVFVTTNKGTTWFEADNGLVNKNIISLIVNDNYLLAGIFGNGVFKANINELIESVGVKDNLNYCGYFNISPNPASNKITIGFHFELINNARVSIFDCLGTELLTQNTSGKRIEFDCSTLPNSIYLCVVKSGSKSYSAKFVVLK